MKCTCGNPEMGFDCVCSFVKNHPGNKSFTCQFCGLYKASEARCNLCQEEPTELNPDNDAKELCNLGLCLSMGEARKIIFNTGSLEAAKDLIQKHKEKKGI
jgi:hypothetical protein